MGPRWDAARFTPRRRCADLRATLAPDGEVLVGYVGRLAPEKHVHRLAALAGLPGIRLVVVGAGPSATRLRTALPDAVFLGFRDGDELARLYASLDVFVHTGPRRRSARPSRKRSPPGCPSSRRTPAARAT